MKSMYISDLYSKKTKDSKPTRSKFWRRIIFVFFIIVSVGILILGYGIFEVVGGLNDTRKAISIERTENINPELFEMGETIEGSQNGLSRTET